MDANLVQILERAISKAQELHSAAAVQPALRQFALMIYSKARISRPSPKYSDLEIKLRTSRRQNGERREKLRQLWTDFQGEIQFLNQVITQNCAMIIQLQQNYQRLAAKEKIMAKNQIIAKRIKLQKKREQIYEIQSLRLNTRLKNIRTDNMQSEKKERNHWNIMKEELKATLIKYDSRMLNQQRELESIRRILNCEASELSCFQEAHLSQEKPYNELMKEREEYLEQRRQQKLYEIRLKIAARTIVKFIEDHYPAWKKKKLKSKKRIKYKFSSDRKK